ncbi:uncharacterized protein M8220_013157 [Acridotheres tristis]
MLQTVCMSPELLVNQNTSESEICGYSPGQGSPLPGETASPKSCLQQSPSLPDSGLTELNLASPKICHPPPPPCQPPGMPAPADSELSSDPPQKRYMGVRVKMPVRELLRKIRLSKGLDPAPGKEASSVKMVTKGSSGKTEKRRTHPYTEKQLRQGKQSAGQTPKGLEDLDILVEVLQEDLNKSQLREEPGHPVPGWICQQDPSALSFFQFQLHREENLLRNIPEEKLLAPDENGNRLLHKAVAQGRRALTFALAQRFASLNKIDQKDAEERTALHLAAEKNQHLMVSDLISLGANVNEQDSSGKTPLHLCAENGYLRVLEVLKNCKNNGVCVEVDVPDRCGLTPLHCAALAHSVLVTRGQSTAGDSGTGRLLRLRKEQILEGILCLLQMGAEPRLQVLNSCQTSSRARLRLEENTELMCLLQAHKPQAQDVLQESCSLLDAPRGIPTPPAAENLPELCSLASSELLDVLLQGFSCGGGKRTQVPCPAGTFRAGGAPHACLPCPEDSFNPRPGQNSCLPCGAQAAQPARGQRTCVCLGKGRLFQPRDSLCTCPPGSRSSGRDGTSCSRERYPACGASTARGQDGQCLSSAAWARYCSHQVCAVPRDFQGYDKFLGLCICHSQSLEGTECDSQCRRQQQKSPLRLSCAGRKSQFFITHANGSKDNKHIQYMSWR